MNGLVALAVALLAAASAWSAEKPLIIVAFGDSTTAPRGHLAVYTTLLQEQLEVKDRPLNVINGGVGGNTTTVARARFEKDVLAQQPNVVVIQFGINDAAVDLWKKPPATQSRVPLATFEKNLRGFCTTLKGRGTRVVLMTPNPLRWTPKLKELYGKPPYNVNDADGFNIVLRDYAEVVRRLAREENVGLVDAFAAFMANPSPDKLLLDGMHPNERGQRLVADLLVERLVSDVPQIAKKPFARWKESGPDVLLNPFCTDITHDTPHATVLGPALAKLDSGAVMSVYSAPTSYGSPPGTTYIAYRITRDSGKTWEAEREITRHPDCQASHATALRTRDGVIHVFYLGFKKHEWKDGNPTPNEKSDVWQIQSADGGKTWTNRQMIFKGYSGATNGACESRDGRIVVPYSHYVSNPGRLNARTSVSSDGGRTWRLSNAIDIGGAGDHEGALEPAVIGLKDGRLWMLIRTSRGQFWESFSIDGGLTWSNAKPTAIESAHAPGHLARLADGRVALVWNPKHTGRRELHVALSDDDGRTWGHPLVVAKGSQVTYPFIMEHQPGELWIGIMDVHGGWGKAPRALHVKVAEQAILAEQRGEHESLCGSLK